MSNPIWFDKMIDKYKSGVSNYFVITGNTEDLITPTMFLDDFLQDRLLEQGFGIRYASPTQSYSQPGERFLDTETELSSISNTIIGHSKNAVILKYADLLLPVPERNLMTTTSGVVTLYETLKSTSFSHSDNMLIFIADSYDDINKKLTSSATKCTWIEIPYPDEKERLLFIQHLDKTSRSKVMKKEISNDDFAKLTAGLTLTGIEDIYLISESNGVLKKRYVKDRKNELIRSEYGDVIEIFDTDEFDFSMFAGQDHLKNYHREVVVEPMSKGDVDIVPKGLLYTGPPGTGKTHFAKCLSGEAGINFVEFKVSKIMDKWVGSSERNFQRALNCFKSITPVGVFVDEIDQMFSRGDDNTGVRNAIFGMFLSALSDPSTRGKIIWIAATNYPNNIDEAMKRTGRFDKKMPFLPPELDDRVETFKIHAKRMSDSVRISDSEYRNLGEITEGYTQAEIEGVVVKSIELMKREKVDVLTMDHVNAALRFIVKANNSKISEMIELAIGECNDLEFLPTKYWDKKK